LRPAWAGHVTKRNTARRTTTSNTTPGPRQPPAEKACRHSRAVPPGSASASQIRQVNNRDLVFCTPEELLAWAAHACREAGASPKQTDRRLEKVGKYGASPGFIRAGDRLWVGVGAVRGAIGSVAILRDFCGWPFNRRRDRLINPTELVELILQKLGRDADPQKVADMAAKYCGWRALKPTRKGRRVTIHLAGYANTVAELLRRQARFFSPSRRGYPPRGDAAWWTLWQVMRALVTQLPVAILDLEAEDGTRGAFTPNWRVQAVDHVPEAWHEDVLRAILRREGVEITQQITDPKQALEEVAGHRWQDEQRTDYARRKGALPARLPRALALRHPVMRGAIRKATKELTDAGMTERDARECVGMILAAHVRDIFSGERSDSRGWNPRRDAERIPI